MQQVLQYFQRRSSAPSATAAPVPACDSQLRVLNFSFVDDAPVDNNVIPFSTPNTVGRTEACVSSSQLSAVGRDQGHGKNLVYLQEELCQKQARRQRTHVLFQDAQPAPRYRNSKIQATALLDASELIKNRTNTASYQKQIARPATNKLLNQKVAQQLNQRSSREELLNKVKDACHKVSSDALVSAPRFHGYAIAPSRQRIQIKIG